MPLTPQPEPEPARLHTQSIGNSYHSEFGVHNFELELLGYTYHLGNPS